MRCLSVLVKWVTTNPTVLVWPAGIAYNSVKTTADVLQNVPLITNCRFVNVPGCSSVPTARKSAATARITKTATR